MTVYLHADGSCSWEYRIQDGTERGTAPNIDAAVDAIKSGMRTLNNTKVKRKDIRLVRAEQVIQTVWREIPMPKKID